MSRAGGPYRDEQYPRQPQQPPQDGYQQRGHPDQGYDPGYQGQGYRDQGYGQGGYDSGYADQGYAGQGYGRPAQGSAPQGSAAQRPAPQRPAPPPDHDDGPSFRMPGIGLVLSLLGLVVQVLSFTVLPWMVSSAGKESQALPAIWDLANNFDARGFAGAYVVLFSYPLAVLGILLSLVAVLESVAMKVVWAGLAIIGIGVLAVKFGFGDLFSGGGLDLSSREMTFAGVALAALVVVLFMLKMAMSTFRRIAGLVLLIIAGVHVYAVSDLSDGFGFEDVAIGAYGPALGYALAAVAAIIGPRRLA